MSTSAARLLEIAAHDVEQWRSEARAEADEIVRRARAEAERLLAEAREEADAVRRDLAVAKRRHETEVAQLRDLADEHRERMRAQLLELLEALDAPLPDRDR